MTRIAATNLFIFLVIQLKKNFNKERVGAEVHNLKSFSSLHRMMKIQ